MGADVWSFDSRGGGPSRFRRLAVRAATLRMLWRLLRGKTGAADVELDAFAHTIAVRSGLPQVTPAMLDEMVRQGRTPLLLDVRTPAEHDRSHISGARLVDRRSALPIAISAIENGRPIVLFCAVGVRSTDLALAIETTLPEHRSIELYNLEGGIFRWYREGRLLVDRRGPTDRVHGFNRYWGRLLSTRR